MAQGVSREYAGAQCMAFKWHFRKLESTITI